MDRENFRIYSSLWIFLGLFFSSAAHAQHEACKNQNEFFDLSYSFGNNTVFYPGSKEFKLSKDFEGDNPNGFWYSAYSFCMGEHGGTHLDAPHHFNKNGWTLDEIPQDRLINVPGVLLDVRHRLWNSKDELIGADYKVEVQDLIQYETKKGKIPSRSVVLVYTGWSKYWPDKIKYLGYENATGSGHTLTFPGISLDAIKWLVEERHIYGIGIDTPSVDHGLDQKYPVHVFGAASNVYNLENVANLHLLLGIEKFRLLILPMKIIGGSGSPTRIIAWI